MDHSDWCTPLLNLASHLRNQKERSMLHDLATCKRDAESAERLAIGAKENKVALPSRHDIITLINNYVGG